MLWLLAGMVLGGGIIFAALKSTTRVAGSKGLRAPQSQKAAPGHESSTMPGRHTDEQTPNTVPMPGAGLEAGPDTASTLFATLFPFFDFATEPAPLASAVAPPPLPGDIRASGPPPLAANDVGLRPFNAPAPKPAPPDVKLVLVDVTDRNSPLGQPELITFAKGLGATIRTYPDFGAKDNTERPGVLVLISDKRLAELTAFIEKEEPAASEMSWKGSAEVRQSRLFDEIDLQIKELQNKRKQLLVRYLKDAPAVLEVDEVLERASQSMSTVKIDGSLIGMAAVRVTFPPGR